MKQIILFIAVLSSINSYAQSWEWAQQIGGTGMDNANISYIDSENNIYLFGRYAIDYSTPELQGSNCYFSSDTILGVNASFVAKYDDDGNLIWVLNFTSQLNYVILNDMKYDSLNNEFFLVGEYSGILEHPGCTIEGSGGTFLSKIDVDGNCIWAKKIGGSLGVESIAIDQTGDLYMTGRAYNFEPWWVIDTCHFDGGIYIAKFNSEGSCLWAKTKVAPDAAYNFSLQQIMLFNHDIVALGGVYSDVNINNITIDTINIAISCIDCWGVALLCMDSTSGAKWIKIDGLPSSGIGPRSLGINSAGDIYYHAGTAYTCIFGNDTISSSGSNWIVVRHDKNGNMLGYNHLKMHSYYNGNNYWGFYVPPAGTYYVIHALSGSAVFGTDTISSLTPLDLFIAHFTDSGECMGLDHLGGGVGTSIMADQSGLFLTGIFSPYASDSGSMTIGNNTFTTHGFEDIVFAKHDLMTGLPKTKGDNSNNSLIIYANPNKGSFRVKLPEEFLHEKNLTLVVYDNQGKAIKSQSLSSTDEHPRLDIFGQKAGIYLVTISNGKKVYSGKLVVQ